ncbi:transcriptional regulator [Rhizobium sp. IBUN]|uniref:3'-5' exonuclease n=1 Tax=Rhizobium sp. IBUN TaxID=1042326 RepID=UPI00041C9025|nr:transcriptional regulator [Rhizobium sp. IBUN]
MIVFLDFEASSLGKHSYPIEIAWVFEDGRSRSFLIRPKPGWTDWSADAERVHGISRDRLQEEGSDVELVVRELMTELSGNELYASSPSWDGKWLGVLLRGGGVPRHALRLRKSDDLFIEVATAILNTGDTTVGARALVAKVIAQSEPVNPAHRALPDAHLELKRLGLVQDTARKVAAAEKPKRTRS